MNISQIAKLSGVSSATVSRFLNNGYVSKENREKIQKIIDETGYIPSVHAKTLRTKKTNVIGVILPKLSSSAVSRMVDGISTELGKEGYNILLGNTDLNLDKEIEYLNLFKNKQVDGIIFIATILTPAHLQVMKSITVPIVVLGQEIEGYHCIYHDDYGASYKLTKAFIERGHRQVAYIGVTHDDKAVGVERQRGYEAALKESGLQVDKALIEEAEFSMESGYIQMKKIYEKGIEIDAVIGATDQIAIGALEFLKENAPKSLDEISLAGMGDTQSSKVVTPRLTSMHYHYKTSGQKAAQMIVATQQQENVEIKKVKLGFELQIRESLLKK